MIIGIDASRAFLSRRTGIEEYSYQAIKHLRAALPSDAEIRLYMRPGQGVDFTLPKHWKIRRLWAPRLWTQVRLSLEMFFHPPDVLFVPAHTVPLIHPKKTIVTIHGLEYEFCPEGYSLLARLYMRWSIRFSCLAAESIVAVSENTKHDLIRLYALPDGKITVISEGFDAEGMANNPSQPSPHPHPFFLFIGRLEIRKNILRIIEAFEIFKQRRKSDHELVLAGKFGFGKEAILRRLEQSPVKDEIVLPGYIDINEKWRLLRGAEAFLFPTLYEGFGIPVLEAQAAGTPVITSNLSSLPETAGEGALLVDPLQPEEIALAMESLVSDPEKRADIMKKGKANAARFSWEAMADSLALLFC